MHATILPSEELKLPPRMVLSPTTGANAGVKVNVSTLKSHCFVTLSWDPKTGLPCRRILNNLGLDELTKGLWKED
jgi:aldehyde:ferredoxin oxidoreductase